jgi:Sulfotransferase family
MSDLRAPFASGIEAGQGVPAPVVMIVGTGRSGTTLVQRIVDEAGCRIPPESHFFSLFAPGLLRRRRFPLVGADLLEEIRSYLAIDVHADLGVDSERIAAWTGDRCDTPADLFCSIVAALADGRYPYGEKTPNHLLWWRPLSRAFTETKFLAVVRDPRSVVSSNLRVHFGMDSAVLLAERWSADQREVLAAQRSLGSARWLTVRYEDVVASPDEARATIASFVGSTSLPHVDSATSRLFLPSETWKENALGPVTTDRVVAWRQELPEDVVRQVEEVCLPEMKTFGYEPTRPGRVVGGRRVWGPPADVWRRLHYRIARRRRSRWIASLDLRAAEGR